MAEVRGAVPGPGRRVAACAARGRGCPGACWPWPPRGDRAARWGYPERRGGLRGLCLKYRRRGILLKAGSGKQPTPLRCGLPSLNNPLSFRGRMFAITKAAVKVSREISTALVTFLRTPGKSRSSKAKFFYFLKWITLALRK